MFRTTVVSLLITTGLALAQTPPCLSANDANNNAPTGLTTSFGFAGQNSFGWQITPTNALVVLAAQVFTSNTGLTGDRYMAVEIWDDAGGLPGQRLAGGAWKIVNSRPPAWQGANLDQFAILQANSPVWVVWIEPGFSVPMIEPNGATTLQLANRSGSGPWSLGSSTQAPKFRLFCNYLDDVNSAPFGAGCAWSSGRLSTVYTNEVPMLGNTGFFFESSGNPVGGAVFVVLGGDPNWVSAPIPGFPAGCLQHTDLLATVLLFAGSGDTRGPDFSGHAYLDFAIPNDPGLTGVFFAAQAVPYDAGATALFPFATSNAHRITLF